MNSRNKENEDRLSKFGQRLQSLSDTFLIISVLLFIQLINQNIKYDQKQTNFSFKKFSFFRKHELIIHQHLIQFD
jgi:hypothetical protein